MIIGEIMIDESHDYDLEEGEILEDDEGEEINISKNFQNSSYHVIEEMKQTFLSGNQLIFIIITLLSANIIFKNCLLSNFFYITLILFFIILTFKVFKLGSLEKFST